MMGVNDCEKDATMKRYSGFLEAFSSYDIDADGCIDIKFLPQALDKMGCRASSSEIKSAIKAAEINHDCKRISFYDFKRVYQEACKGDPRLSTIGNVCPKSNVYHYGAAGGEINDDTLHTVSEDEQIGFSSWIERNLRDDAECNRYLPLKADGSDLYDKCTDGIVLCKIINCSVPKTIDPRALNKHYPLTTFQMHENITLALNSARAIGCNVVNIGAGDILNGTKHLLLGLLWQIIKIGLLKQINVVAHAELATLLEGEETISDFAKLSPEEILIRWVNYHLKGTDSETRMENFSFDVRNSEVYAYLVEKIAPQEKKPFMHSARAILEAVDLVQRAEMVLHNAEQLNCRVFVRPQDIVSGSQKLNLAFLANLFHGYPALEKSEEVEEKVAEIQETREEKTYRNWINSMGLSYTVNYLFSDLNDGLILLKMFDLIRPKTVDWTQINTTLCSAPAKAGFQCLENCNYVIDLGRYFGFSLVGVGGEDIYQGKQTMTLALLWQLMRAYTLSLLTRLSEAHEDSLGHHSPDQGGPMEEGRIIDWANWKLRNANKMSRISREFGFADPNLKTSLAVIDLIDAIRPGSVDYSLVLSGRNKEVRKSFIRTSPSRNNQFPGIGKLILLRFDIEETCFGQLAGVFFHKVSASEEHLFQEQLANAQYAIPLARRVGASVYAVPEDLVELKHKMIMTIFACLMIADFEQNQKPRSCTPDLIYQKEMSSNVITKCSDSSTEVKSYMYIGRDEYQVNDIGENDDDNNRKLYSKPIVYKETHRAPNEKIYIKSFRLNLSSTHLNSNTARECSPENKSRAASRDSCYCSSSHNRQSPQRSDSSTSFSQVRRYRSPSPTNRYSPETGFGKPVHRTLTSSHTSKTTEIKTQGPFLVRLSKSTPSVNQIGRSATDQNQIQIKELSNENVHDQLTECHKFDHPINRHRELADSQENRIYNYENHTSRLYTLAEPNSTGSDTGKEFSKSIANHRSHGGGRLFLATGAKKYS